MRALRWVLPFLVSFGFAVAASAAEVPIPATPSAWVTDTAGLLSQQTVSTLDDRLRAYESSTGHQILVYIAPTTGVAPTEDWTNRAFTRWKVGRKGIDDGLVLFIFPTDHKVRIEVGYGLEQTVPDVIASRIIRNTITPKMKDGSPDAAVTAGIDELLALAGGEPQSSIATSPPDSEGTSSDADSGTDMTAFWIGVVIAVIIIVLVLWLISKLPNKGPYISGRNSGFSVWDALSIGSSLLGGFSGGGGGGGFSGGGGMGGGGGATGSW